MYKENKIAVVVPCYNEESQIDSVLDTIPDFVDKVIVIDDHSKDETLKKVKKYSGKNKAKLELICHDQNLGVGGAISSGYIWCREHDIDIAVVMAGDGQMDPQDLPSLLNPIAEGNSDYVKGNRLMSGEAWEKIPKVRYFGNSILTLLTKIASGYWHVTDSQSGYTALNRKGLDCLPLSKIYPGYGMPNDFLVTLNIYNLRVMDVPINPLYGIGEKSSMVIHRTIPSLLYLMVRLFLKRMVRKYIIRDFHPLIFFYITGVVLGLLACPICGKLLYTYFQTGNLKPINSLAAGFTVIMSLQFLFFAMWFDMDYNRSLCPRR